MTDAETISTLLSWRVARTPEAECLRFQGTTLSFTQVADRAARLASVLRTRGVGPGDRVAVMLPNGIEFAVAWLGIPLLGAMVVPVNSDSRDADLEHLLRHSGARHALAGSAQFDAISHARNSCPTLETVDVWGAEHAASIDSAVASARPIDDPPRRDPREPVTIQYTSGTTGLPKGCVMDHEYWLTLARTIQRHLRLSPGDVMLTAQRQSYMDPSWNLVLAILAGVPLVVLPRFSASGFWRSVREHGVTFFYCIGTMPLYLMKQPVDPIADRDHRVRVVYCSGIPPALHGGLEERWGCPWRETYGTTELGVVLMVPPDRGSSVGTASMGTPVWNREVRVVGEQGEDLAPGRPGEMLVRGVGMMREYYRDPEATAAWKPDGWARTGDIVVQHESGGYRLVGRKKDMIRRAGENVSAAEVESVLVHHPVVKAAACVPVPDELRGEEIKAYVQLTDGVDPGSVDPSTLREFVASHLAPFKVPRFFEFVEVFPLTASEKIAKAELLRSRRDHRSGAWDAESQIT